MFLCIPFFINIDFTSGVNCQGSGDVEVELVGLGRAVGDVGEDTGIGDGERGNVVLNHICHRHCMTCSNSNIITCTRYYTSYPSSSISPVTSLGRAYRSCFYWLGEGKEKEGGYYYSIKGVKPIGCSMWITSEIPVFRLRKFRSENRNDRCGSTVFRLGSHLKHPLFCLPYILDTYIYRFIP